MLVRHLFTLLPLLALLQGLLKDLVVRPELQHLALPLYKVHIGRYFLVHLNLPPNNKKSLVLPNRTKVKLRYTTY